MPIELREQEQQVNIAFSKQSGHFDEDDLSNSILQQWRQRVYDHVDQFIKPNSKILELNAGTGIDAMHFAKSGHHVHATDLSDGMIAKLKEKISMHSLQFKITAQQVSFENLDHVEGKFDFIFSNFGGLNCSDDLTKITKHLPGLLSENGYVLWVIMPRIAPWEWLWIFKGKFKEGFRRFNRSGVSAHLEGKFFPTYYFSLGEIKKAIGDHFQLIKTEGLGIFSPPPSALNFLKRFSGVTKFLNGIDKFGGNKYPFNKWGDHIIVTFQKAN